jgi:hypothetical protein
MLYRLDKYRFAKTCMAHEKYLSLVSIMVEDKAGKAYSLNLEDSLGHPMSLSWHRYDRFQEQGRVHVHWE